MRKSINSLINTRKDLVDFLRSDKNIAEIFNLKSSISHQRIDLYRDCYHNIGNTPYHRIPLRNGNKLFVKLEYKNAMGHNHYSRYWIPYLFIAETLGLITPGEDHILEVTSGSSGIALAHACEGLGYGLTIVVPDSLSSARYRAMEKPCVTIVPVTGYIDACIQKMLEIRDTGNYFMANHAEEKADIITAVFARIAHEFIREVGTPDFSILALGNGTSAEAVTTTFQRHQGNRRCWFLAYHPDFSQKETKPVLGLLPPNVKFRHVESMKEKIDTVEFTNQYDITSVRNQYYYDEEIQRFGQTTLYGLAIAQKLSKEIRGQTMFAIGYDTIDMYD